MRKIFAVTLIFTVTSIGTHVFAAPAKAIKPAGARAQVQEVGRIVGVLKDAAGQPIANATVNVVNAAGQIVSTVVTDAAGVFTAVNVPVGAVTIQASVAGQALAGVTSVTVAAGTTATVTAVAGAAGALAVSAGATGLAGIIATLGPIATAAIVGAAAVGTIVAVQAVKDNASPSR